MNKLAIFASELNSWYENRVRSKYPLVTKEQAIQNGIIVYGASTIGEGVVSQLIQYGVMPQWVVDRNPDLIGRELLGIPIKSISTLSQAGNRYVLLASTHILEMINECRKHNAKWILYDSLRSFCHLVSEIGYAGVFPLERNAILKSAQLFKDKKSFDIYKKFIKYHYTFDNDFSTLSDSIEYFPDDLIGEIDYSYFVDAGAFDGDTLKSWVRYFNPSNKLCTYYAFEPNSDSFAKLAEYSATIPDIKVKLYNMALSETANVAYIGGYGAVTIMIDSNDATCKNSVVKIDTIDSLLANERVSVIKADVEGFELPLLRGAVKTIKNQRPTLMISIYHHYSDVWTIPHWIDQLGLGYSIYLRHAPKVFSDTVCYAIPPKLKGE